MTLRSRTIEELARHADELARAFNVPVVEIPNLHIDESMANSLLGVVVVAPVVDEATYIAKLHEIGHIAAPLGNLGAEGNYGNIDRALITEEAAWEWAQAMAEQFGIWTATMEAVKTNAYATYANAKAELVEARRRAIENRGYQTVADFTEKVAPDVPRPTSRPARTTRRESIADFMNRRTR